MRERFADVVIRTMNRRLRRFRVPGIRCPKCHGPVRPAVQEDGPYLFMAQLPDPGRIWYLCADEKGCAIGFDSGGDHAL